MFLGFKLRALEREKIVATAKKMGGYYLEPDRPQFFQRNISRLHRTDRNKSGL